MSAIPLGPEELHTAISKITEHYASSTKAPTTPVELRAIKSIFFHLESSPPPSLSEKEIQTLNRLYQDITHLPGDRLPLPIDHLKKCQQVLSRALNLDEKTAPLPSLEDLTTTDPLLNKWKGLPAGTPEGIAYARITRYAANPKDSTQLDLSGLYLEELPACLFIHPDFANAYIIENNCLKYPENLTVDSICNIDLYEEMKKQIKQNFPFSKEVLSNPDLILKATSHLSSKEQKQVPTTNKAFRSADELLALRRIEKLRDQYQEFLSPDLLTEIDLALTPPAPGSTKTREESAREAKLIEVHIEEVLPQKLQDDSLIKAFPRMLVRLPENIRAEFEELPPTSSPENKAQHIRAFLSNHQEATNNVNELDFNSLELHVIPREVELFRTLKIIELLDNNISDISPLRSLTQLHSVFFPNNNVDDITPLASLPDLQILSADNNNIHDISPLSNLSRLDTVDLSNNKISDISPLQSLSALSSLYINNNQLSDLSALTSLKQIQALEANNNQISDISSLENFSQLRSLNLNSNKISNISVLSSCPGLLILELGGNRISDISSLQALTQLRTIDFSNNPIPNRQTVLASLQGQFPSAEITL